jgi:hypothetical protein
LRQSHLFRKTPCHAPATVKSDSNVNLLAKDGYAVTGHRFAKPGHYLVRVERTNEQGQRATAFCTSPSSRKAGANKTSGRQPTIAAVS